MTTITRFAPSPTGYIHVGNLRTALMNYLIARKSGGQFILRLDDTDQERSKQEYADGIMRDLEWLGLHWDRIEKQSLRLERYREAAEDLKAKARFYECFESPVELDLKRKKQLNMHKPPVYDRASLHLSDDEKAKMRAEGREGYWRFLLNQTRIEWADGIIGPVSIDAASVSDPVLIRADGQVLYTFASSVDDIDMGVTHIVRGADHVTNTATQIQIMEAMGGTPPAFAHHSLLTGAKGEELSKRLARVEQQARTQQNRPLHSALTQARWLAESLAMRRSTVCRVAEFIVRHHAATRPPDEVCSLLQLGWGEALASQVLACLQHPQHTGYAGQGRGFQFDLVLLMGDDHQAVQFFVGHGVVTIDQALHGFADKP